METSVDEIAPGIYRLSTFVPGLGRHGFTFNQFLIDAEEPLLFHCGQRSLFSSVSAAAATIMDLSRLRWISFSHVESDECGSLEQWLAAAPRATPALGRIGCAIWLNDACARAPRVLAAGEVVDLGGRRVRRLDTPHVPHNWEAGLLYEEQTGTLFCSDLFTQTGTAAAVTDGDVLTPAIEAEAAMGFSSLGPHSVPTLRRLASLSPKTLAIMHGASYRGDCTAALEGLACDYERRLAGV